MSYSRYSPWSPCCSTKNDNSDPLAQSERRESLWAIEWRGRNDYTFIEATGGVISSCHMENISIKYSKNYTVGFLHVEPFKDKEQIIDQVCLENRGSNRLYYKSSEPSDKDSGFVVSSGKPLYVIDKNKIKIINSENPNSYSETHNRCGY